MGFSTPNSVPFRSEVGDSAHHGRPGLPIFGRGLVDLVLPLVRADFFSAKSDCASSAPTACIVPIFELPIPWVPDLDILSLPTPELMTESLGQLSNGAEYGCARASMAVTYGRTTLSGFVELDFRHYRADLVPRCQNLRIRQERVGPVPTGFSARDIFPDPVRSLTPRMYFHMANFSFRSATSSSVLESMPETEDRVVYSVVEGPDYCSDIPDDILACFLQFLCTDDRKQCSRMCRGWLVAEGQSSYCLSLNEHSKCVCLVFRNPECTNLGLVCMPVVLHFTVGVDGMDAAIGLWLCSQGSCLWVNGLIACTRAMVLGWPWVICSLFHGCRLVCSCFLCQGCGWDLWLVFLLPGVWALLYLVVLTNWPGCSLGFIWFVCQLAFVCFVSG